MTPGFVIIPRSMDDAIERDLDKIRDTLPEAEHAAFDADRPHNRQVIINHFAEHGTYPEISGVERVAKG